LADSGAREGEMGCCQSPAPTECVIVTVTETGKCCSKPFDQSLPDALKQKGVTEAEWMQTLDTYNHLNDCWSVVCMSFFVGVGFLLLPFLFMRYSSETKRLNQEVYAKKGILLHFTDSNPESGVPQTLTFAEMQPVASSGDSPA
jgi:hypothetical protein